MESKVNYAIVGAFVVTLIAAITFAIIWLSAGFNNKEYNTYRSYINESVTGLSIDSPVKYSGVDVGLVKEIKLSNNNPQLVEILMDIEEGTPITKSTVATLTSQGLTGVAYIDLKTKGNDLSPLVKLPGQKYPVIPSFPSLFSRLDTSVSLLINNMNSISDDLRNVLNKQNQKAFSDSLANINTLSRNLANDSVQLHTIIVNTSQASNEFPMLIQTSNNAVKSFSNQTVPAANQLLSTLNATANNLLSASDQIKQNPAVIIRGKTNPPLGPGER